MYLSVPVLLPKDPTSNPPPNGTPITDYGTSDSDYYYLPIPASESEGYPGIDFPSYFPTEGGYLPPEVATEQQC